MRVGEDHRRVECADIIQPESRLQRDTADQGVAVGLGPAFEFGEILFLDQELGAAGGTDHGVTTVAARFAPLEHGTVGVTVARAKVGDNLLDIGAEGGDIDRREMGLVAHADLRGKPIGTVRRCRDSIIPDGFP